MAHVWAQIEFYNSEYFTCCAFMDESTLPEELYGWAEHAAYSYDNYRDLCNASANCYVAQLVML